MPKVVDAVMGDLLVEGVCRRMYLGGVGDSSVELEPAAVTDRLGDHRGELLALCYRMLGSVDDAEDAVQDTLVRAWRAADRYDPARASLRTWLYRIATNVCLTSAAVRRRRALPAALGAPGDDPTADLVPSTEIAWLQPFPDALVAADDPAAAAVRRGDLRLALVAALQRLPARQRAAVILREALDCSAAEIADVLDTTPAAVNSAPAARPRHAAGARRDEEHGATTPDERRFVEAYAAAFERADVAAIRELVTADVILEMPPVPLVRRSGRPRPLHGRVFATRGTGWRVLPISANGQPGALVAYSHGAGSERSRRHSYQVLGVTAAGTRRMTAFDDQCAHGRSRGPGRRPFGWNGPSHRRDCHERATRTVS